MRWKNFPCPSLPYIVEQHGQMGGDFWQRWQFIWQDNNGNEQLNCLAMKLRKLQPLPEIVPSWLTIYSAVVGLQNLTDKPHAQNRT